MSTQDLSGQTIVVTGASDGIGAVAARTLSERGARVLVVGRSPEKTERVATAIGAERFVADFARLDDVRRLAGELEQATDHIDVLLNNAGGTFAPSQRTHDGHEPNLGINHLAPFLLTHLLRGRLGRGSRVINTSSVANLLGHVNLGHLDRSPRSQFRAYGTSKLANVLFSRGIARRWSDDGVVSAAVHPGAVGTSFGRDSFLIGLAYRTPLKRVVTITPEQGATPLVSLAADRPAEEIDGRYFDQHRADGMLNRQARDDKLVEDFWTASAELVGL